MSASDCGKCGRLFKSLTAFDLHQTTAYGTTAPVTCHDPATRGLEMKPSGRWGGPQDAAGRLRAEQMRAERDLAHAVTQEAA